MYSAVGDGGQRLGYDGIPRSWGTIPHSRRSRPWRGQGQGGCVRRAEPATSLNGNATRLPSQLDWLVVKDNCSPKRELWYQAPEVKDGRVSIGDNKTEIFLLPSTQIAEYDGSFTKTRSAVAVALQGGRRARRLPHRHLVLPQPREAPEEGVRRSTAPRDQDGTTCSGISIRFRREAALSGEPDALRSCARSTAT